MAVGLSLGIVAALAIGLVVVASRSSSDDRADVPSGTSGDDPTAANTDPPTDGGKDAESTGSGSHHSPEGPSESLYRPTSGCADGSRLVRGQANPSVEAEPQGAAWCFALATPLAPTRLSIDNSWVDEFDTDAQMQRFDDGDMGYRTFDGSGELRAADMQHFVNNNHWMVDVKGASHGGTSIRPDRSFTFEDGRFIIEGDIASNMAAYDGLTHPGLVITSAPEPTGVISDALYSYGQFGGYWTVGCRLEGATPICAVEGDTPEVGMVDTGHCFPQPVSGWRLVETSWFQECGTTNWGGEEGTTSLEFPDRTIGEFTRRCEDNQMDMHCRDRWRMEVFKDGLVLYVNGVKYFEDSGWPADRQLPDSFLEGPVYAYQTDWHNGAEDDQVFRFHWDHFLVNPRDSAGRPIPPTAAPSFCLGEPGNTCPMVSTAPDVPVPSKDQVDVLDFVYGTPSITVEVGQTVTWTNKTVSRMAHTVTATDGSFDSGPLAVGETFSWTFDTPGTYDYLCVPHPSMTGTVIVVPPAS